MTTGSKKSVAKGSNRSLVSSPNRKPRTTTQWRTIENTDLNVDDARTNADVTRDEDAVGTEREQNDSAVPVNDARSVNETSVEEEQDREALRKMEDNHPDEALN